jgi:hypothetical protein
MKKLQATHTILILLLLASLLSACELLEDEPTENPSAADINRWLEENAANGDELDGQVDPDTGLPVAPEGQEHQDNPVLGDDGAFVFVDDALDEVICTDGSPTSDPPVDILEVSVLAVDGGVEVKVRMNSSAADAAHDYSLSIQARLGRSTSEGGGGFQVGIYEFHDGQARVGRLETTVDLEEGTEGDVSVDGEVVTIFFPNTTINEGDSVTARAFHLTSSADQKTCDQTETFGLDIISDWFPES